MSNPEPRLELWVDDHLEIEPGVVLGFLRNAQLPLDPHPGDYLVVGDGEIPAHLAEVLERSSEGQLKLRYLPGKAESHPEYLSRRVPILS